MVNSTHEPRTALTYETEVQADGSVALQVPLAPGARVMVVVIAAPDDLPPEARRSALDILADAPGQRLFKTADEVDAYIAAERDAWE